MDNYANLSFEPSYVNRDLNLLFPPVKEAAQHAIVAAQNSGMSIDIFEAWRSPQRQDWLYSQGRSREGKVVTQSVSWQSWHNYGLAVDIAFKDEAGNWSWNGNYQALVPIFKGFGLDWIGPQDIGHYEMRRGMTTPVARGLMQSGGLQRVWIEVSSGKYLAAAAH